MADHCRNAASYAGEVLAEVSLYYLAYLAGLIHDMGKAIQKFQQYLYDATHGQNAVRGSVNHTFAAVRYILTRFHNAQHYGEYASLTAEILAYAVGAHHGLFDCVDGRHRSGFRHRLEKEDIDYQEAVKNFLDECVNEKKLDTLFIKAVQEVESFFTAFLTRLEREPTFEESLFYIGLLARLLLSSVEEGDRRDTAEFMGNIKFPKLRASKERIALWNQLSRRVDAKLNALPKDTPIQRARQTISDKCRDFAQHPGGVYRLNVPTGAGKTLSSLRFALAHAAKWGKSRIVFTSPLLAILEQNCSVIREYIQDDDLILEHHSNIVRSREVNDELDFTDLLTATWNAPIIITTLVQLLNTLFDGGGGSIRRFNSLCDSVIIIDEVQTVPSHLLSLFNLAVTFLSGACRATVILCSATQPCSEVAEHPIAVPAEDMVPYDEELWKLFRRTVVKDYNSAKLDDIPMMANEFLKNTDSLLIVCNKKSEAETLFKAFDPQKYQCYHLSAAMCIEHRRQMLKKLRDNLNEPKHEKKIVCISTQVIEAGVDISFGGVIRLAAGMDSIVQSAGRCNRNGESSSQVPVGIVQCAGEDLNHLSEIKQAKDATLALLSQFKQTPEQFKNDLTSDDAIRYYYRHLYQKEMPSGLQNGPVTTDGRKTTLFSMLSDNDAFIDPAFNADGLEYIMRQAFKTAGKCFKVFDDEATDVLVPYGDGREIIVQLGTMRLPYDLSRMHDLMERAKPYTVSVYGWQKQQLEKQNALISLCDGSVFVLQEGYYDECLGLTVQSNTLNFLEV